MQTYPVYISGAMLKTLEPSNVLSIAPGIYTG
jgi:hypothetical protein